MSTVLIDGVEADHDAWLAERRKGIGASEMPIVLGLTGSRLQVYLDKLGLLPPGKPTAAMRRGLKWEPYIAAEWGEITGDPIVERQRFVRHPAIPWCLATIDGVTESGRRVEMKMIGPHGLVRAVEGPDDVECLPEPFIVQAHHQMLADDVDEVWFALLMPDHEVYPVGPLRRDEDLIDVIREAGTDFWFDHVVAGVPPEDIKPEDAGTLGRAYRGQLGGWLVLGHDIAEAAYQYKSLGQQINELQRDRDVAKARMLLALENSGGADLPGGWSVERRVVQVKGHFVEESTQVRLTVKEPKS
jgi:putative phage-type endonuclease